MTFYDISIKMLTANFKRYKLYFLCNVLSIVLFYNFAALYTNKLFMNKDIVDYMISSNIFAPTVFVAIFLVLFVPYSYNAFSKKRKHEYGILMTLGMSETEVLRSMLIENCIIAAISLISGLVLGTLISFAFYFIIQDVIGVSQLHWYFNLDSYKITVILYIATILFTLMTGILGFVKMQITDLIKEKFMPEKKGRPHPCIFAAGLVLIIISILIMVTRFNGYINIWLISLAMMFAGFYLVITHAETVEHYFIKIISHYRERHIIEMAFIRQHNKSHSIITMAAALLIGFCIFFAGFCTDSYFSLMHNAITYSPYDMVYCQLFSMNKVKDSEVKSLLNENGISVNAVKQLDYLRGRAFNLLPVSEVNKNLNRHYQIPVHKFLTVFQFAQDDGYEHEMESPKTVCFDCSGKTIELQMAGSDVKILFNDNPTFADKTLILNDEDYNKLASGSRDFWAGIIKLYSFDSWKNSQKGINAVQKYLLHTNKLSELEQKHYYRASSKIEAYTTAQQSAKFLIFLMFFIEVLFCAASVIMIHFKIKAESEEEQRMLSGLYRIGAANDEMLKMIRHKNIYYYMPQVLIGLFTGVFYCYVMNQFYEHTWKAAGYSLLFGIMLIALQSIVIIRYSKKELLSFGI